jgi:copper chaperone
MGKMDNITLKVAGMACAHCERRVSDALKKLDGVKKASASAKNGEVAVSFDTDRTDVEKIRTAIEQSGYSPM